jgi:hypothetical protein
MYYLLDPATPVVVNAFSAAFSAAIVTILFAVIITLKTAKVSSTSQ